MKIIRTDCLTNERRVYSEYEDITTHTAEQFLILAARNEALHSGHGAVQINFPGGYSGRATATVYDSTGVWPKAVFSQEWPQE
jgi:hypothetical protein